MSKGARTSNEMAKYIVTDSSNSLVASYKKIHDGIMAQIDLNHALTDTEKEVTIAEFCCACVLVLHISELTGYARLSAITPLTISPKTPGSMSMLRSLPWQMIILKYVGYNSLENVLYIDVIPDGWQKVVLTLEVTPGKK